LYLGKFEVFTAVTMKNAVFWDINPSSYLIGDTLRLCYRAQLVNVMQGLRFYGGEYEKFRVLRYKTPVRTSQETYYLSATEHSRLMLCKI
jgi:hypothetical protein